MRTIRIRGKIEDNSLSAKLISCTTGDAGKLTVSDMMTIASILRSSTSWEPVISANWITADGFALETADGFMFNVADNE